MKSLIIFAGAGASRGVSGEKYPMAIDFRKRLPESVRKSDLYNHLYKWLGGTGLGESVDIEHILWELGRLNEVISEMTESSHFLSQFLTNNQIQSVLKSSGPSGPVIHGSLSHLRRISTQLQDQINERVYDFYSIPPEEGELNRSWKPLLEYVFKKEFSRVDIVTTNYDLVIEAALEQSHSEKISLGFQQGIFPGINLDAWRSIDSSLGMLTKLHGSVDWKLGNGSTDNDPIIRRGHPEFDGDHKKRLILYPGFKGTPSSEPFVAFHEYFRRRVQEASHLVFIGFAFRDSFINELIASAIPPESKVAVINPTAGLPALPFLRDALHLQKGFGLKTSPTLLGGDGMAPFNTSQLDEWIGQ